MYYRRLYWTSRTPPAIQYGPMSGNTSPQNLVTSDLVAPRHLALDVVENMLYWTDGPKGTVEVINLQTNYRRIVFLSSNSFPFGITVYQV